jgi:hypothetical protein
MSDEPSPAKLTDEFSSKASDPRTESHMSATGETDGDMERHTSAAG